MSVPPADPIHRRRGAPTTRAVVVVAVALVVLGASVVSGSASVRALAGGGCAAADTPHVGLVIDFGTVTGVSGAPTPAVQTACLPFTPGEDGADLLSAAGVPLRWGSSGLLCSIDRYPASGCGVDTPGGYQYWSYWHGGSGGWTYSTVGPTSYRLSAGSVEGWRFVQGHDSSTEGQPRYAASGPCPTSTSTTAGPTPTSPSPTNPAPPRPGVQAPSASTSVPVGGATTTSASPSATTPTSPDPATTATGSDTDAAHRSASHGPGSHRAEALPEHGEIAARSGRGSPVGPILVVLVIVGLVVASVLIRRRRRPA